MISKDNPLPLYYQVKEDLFDKIKRNIYKIGECIPSESQLLSIYNVSRTTLRTAIQELVYEGYLYALQGKGTFVNPPKAVQDLNYITCWTETIKKLGMRPETKSIKYAQEPANQLIAKLLDIESGKIINKIERLRYANGEPLCIMTNYLIPEIAPRIFENGLIGESLYETLEKEYGVVLKRAIEKVEVTAATKEQALLLNVNKGFRLLHVLRITFDMSDRPFEVVSAFNRGDRYAYEVQLVGRQ